MRIESLLYPLATTSALLRPALGLLGLLVLLLSAAPAWAMVFSGPMDLTVQLHPSEHRLIGRARIALSIDGARAFDCRLTPNATAIEVTVDGKALPFHFSDGWLTIGPMPERQKGAAILSIGYQAIFNDAVPRQPANMDNPGFGVTGTISATGVFILGGAGWYPLAVPPIKSMDLTVIGPLGWTAATAGRLVAIEHQKEKSVTRWEIRREPEAIALSAAKYQVREQKVGRIAVMTFLRPGSHHLAPRYLQASAAHLQQFENRFGPYPFEKFAVVENFFPTGYGFPSYTLLGTRVLHLPFIPATSLAHEIAHCWWGNGVRVDAAQGNWCEGLTSYVADYFNKEKRSELAASDHRRQALRNFSSLVQPGKGYDLTHFRHRTDPISKSVGYDKASMVFHMLRREIGDEAFWQALRDLYRERVGRATAWEHLQSHFEARVGRSLSHFFEQWVHRPGAPSLYLQDVHRKQTDGSWRVSGKIVQSQPFYRMNVPIELSEQKTVHSTEVVLTGVATDFELTAAGMPLKLSVDPDFHVFRRLAPSELPTTINTLKSLNNWQVEAADASRPKNGAAIRRLMEGLGARRPVAYAPPAAPSARLWVGPVTTSRLQALFEDRLRVSEAWIEIGNQKWPRNGHGLFAVAPRPDADGHPVALFIPPAGKAATAVAGKIPHYGRYSYLVFRQNKVISKASWQPKNPPLEVSWQQTPKKEEIQ